MMQRVMLFSFLLLGAGWAQAQTVSVFHITDGATGKPLPEARVIVSDMDKKPDARSFRTDEKGNVHVENLKAPFRLQIRSIGYMQEELVNQQVQQEYAFKLYRDTLQLKEYVITGMSEPQQANKAVYKVRVIDEQKIRGNAAVNLADVLKNELNVRIGNDKMLGSGLSIQGLSGQNVKILMDGMPLFGRENGNIDLTQINMNDIERIEIIEGPMSVVYGTDALGGVVNLITKKQRHQYRAGANAYYETIGRYNLDAFAGFNHKGHSLQASGGRNFFEGWSAIDSPSRVKQWLPKEQYFGDLKYAWRSKEGKTNLSYFGSYFNEKMTFKGEPHVDPYAGYALDDYYYTTRIVNRVNASFTLRNNSKLELSNAYNIYTRHTDQYSRNLVTVTDSVLGKDVNQSRFDDINLRGVYSSTYNDKLNVQLGYDVLLEQAKSYKFDDNKSLQDYGVFATADWKPVKGLSLLPGLRWSYNTRFKAPVVPSLNVRYAVDQHWTLRGSYAMGFRAPTLKELYLDFNDGGTHDISGNENLKAEQSHNFQVLSDYTRATASGHLFSFELGLYYNYIYNRIFLANVVPGTIVYKYVNTGEYQNLVGTARAKYMYHNLKAELSGAFTNVLTIDSIKNYVSPELAFNASYSLPKTGISFNLYVKYNGRQPNIVSDVEGLATVNGFVNDYLLGDYSVSKTLFNRQLTLQAGIKNLFNQTYATTTANSNLNTGGHSGAGQSGVAISPERSFFIAIRYEFTH